MKNLHIHHAFWSPRLHHLGARFWKDCERWWNRSLEASGCVFSSGFGSVKWGYIGMGMGMHFSYEASNYPLVNVYITMERSTIFNGKIHYKRSFSIAMLNYQRVYQIFSKKLILAVYNCQAKPIIYNSDS